jgi:hypothetical protein
MNRLVQPELLDTLRPEDPRAIRSRQDLRRLNAWMGNARIMRAALKDFQPAWASGGLMEIGAGDGSFLLRVVAKLPPAPAGATVTLLDRQPGVSAQTVDHLTRLGWRVETVVADVFDHPAPSKTAAVLANLFLHHFADDRLSALLLKLSRETDLLIAVEPHRFARPWLCSQLLRLIGCSPVTLHDARISIGAGFVGRDLSALWPDQNHWRLTEQRAGGFSHLFIAQRIP